MSEKWLPVPEYEGLYSASTRGRVRSEYWTPYRILRPSKIDEHNRYPRVTLTRDGKQAVRRVHDIVLKTFVGPRPPGQEALHRNGVRTDSRLTNLRYGTHVENGRDTTAYTKECYRGHKFTKANTYIRPDNGTRMCLTCIDIRNRNRTKSPTIKQRRAA